MTDTPAALPPASAPLHQPVLAVEAVEALRIDDSPLESWSVRLPAVGGSARSAAHSSASTRRAGLYIDATFGRGGHSRLILERLAAEGRLLAIDRDQAAIDAGRSIRDPRLALVHARFGALRAALGQALQDDHWAGGVRAPQPAAATDNNRPDPSAGAGAGLADGVLMDLGVSSPQLDEAGRGFSFRSDGPLDMRMDQSSGLTAAEWLATAPQEHIREVLERYGQERFAKQVAKAIVSARARGPIERTRQLAAVVGEAVRTREPGKDPATRTFQALRIHINQELEELSLALPQALEALRPGGRLAVISFHSLEDRMVKHFFREAAQGARLPERLPVRAADLPPPRLRVIGKALRPSERECAANPRSRSAVLRVAEKMAAAA